jgi:hypothetical protein
MYDTTVKKAKEWLDLQLVFANVCIDHNDGNISAIIEIDQGKLCFFTLNPNLYATMSTAHLK